MYICSWAEENNLKLKNSKSKEIVIYRKNAKILVLNLPPLIQNNMRVKNPITFGG